MHFDHPIFIVLIAIAALLRWLSQRAERTRDSDTDTTSTVPESRRNSQQTEEQRVRRFLEALGQPSTSTPPPKVTPKRVEPKRAVLSRRPIGPVLPPLTTRPPDYTGNLPPPIPTLRRVEPTPSARVTREAAMFEVREVGIKSADEQRSPVATLRQRAAVSPATLRKGFAARFATVEGLRDAIVLREIFGPPRGLESADHF